MKPKLILSLALVLSGGLLGCSSVPQPSDKSEQSPLPLYMYSILPTFDGGKTRGRLILSTQINLSKDFFATTTNNDASLMGNVKCSQQKLVAHIEGRLYGTTGIYDGEIVPEKPFSPQILVHSATISLTFFVLSTNRNCEPFLKPQAANIFEQAEKVK